MVIKLYNPQIQYKFQCTSKTNSYSALTLKYSFSIVTFSLLTLQEKMFLLDKVVKELLGTNPHFAQT